MTRDQIIPLIGKKVILHFNPRETMRARRPEELRVIDVGEKFIVGPNMSPTLGEGPKLYSLKEVRKITYSEEQVVE